MNKWLISVFDLTGNASRPYREDRNWMVTQIDIQNGIDFLKWDWEGEFMNKFNLGCADVNDIFKRTFKYELPEVGIIAMIPCTHDATSGAKHFKHKDETGITKETDVLVDRLFEMITFFSSHGVLKFWQVEQPRTRLHNRFKWLKPRRAKFNPCDYAGYDPEPNNSRYNKETWLFGEFKPMVKKRLEPLTKDNPGWRKYGGKSLKTKNARSVTPLGFSYAFHHTNH